MNIPKEKPMKTQEPTIDIIISMGFNLDAKQFH